MKKILWIVLLHFSTVPAFSQYLIYKIANCKGERRTILFDQQISDALVCASGERKFKGNLSFKISPKNKLNLDSLDKAGIQFKKAIPTNFWNKGVQSILLDTKPNEEGHIWVENVFVEEDSKGKFKVLAALRVDFEGTNVEKERSDPRVRNIIMTSDPAALKKYVAIIQGLKIANNAQIKESKKNTPPPPFRN